MTKSLHRYYRRFGKGITEEMSLQAFPKTGSDGANMTFCNRLLRSRAAETGKAQSPMNATGVCVLTQSRGIHM